MAKFIFFGTPRFAEIVLDGLIEGGMTPTALVCNPDRPLGRKKIVTPPPTKRLIADKKLSTIILQPEKLDDDVMAQLRTLEPDFFVVAAYAKIIPGSVLTIPRLGTLGTHPSLLPEYRGASPIQSVILAGETKTGVTIYHMDEKMDHGAIFAQEEVPLDALATDYLSLEAQLAALSARLLLKTIPVFLDGTALPRVQDESHATFTKKFTTENGFIEYSELDAAITGNSDKAELIVRTIHALNPEPGVWTIKDGKRIKLLEARMDGSALKLVTIQEEGQRAKAI
ncbi:MAG TPA: methionyl-tRNA formyltransferase [Candidatus Paceibacterota bacterium]|nr:methionyl-tRNA formyltransferase [Candidatus Paceibacterota bacterium]